MSANFALLALIKDALGLTWPPFLLKYVFISASKAKLADIFMPYFCDDFMSRGLCRKSARLSKTFMANNTHAAQLFPR